MTRGFVIDMDAVDHDQHNSSHIFAFNVYYRLVMRGLTSVERRFRVVPLADIEREFQSDRSHMRSATTGDWLAPPPTWDVLFGAQSTNLFSCYVDMDDDDDDARFGRVLSEVEFVDSFGKAKSVQ